jgi:ankyrin repeat protein
MEGRIVLCEMLLATEGCEPGICDRNGATPFLRAVQGGHLQVVELLQKQRGVNIFRALPSGATMLHIAAEAGQKLMLEYLQRSGIYVDAVTHEGVTPLLVAAQNGHTAAVQAPLEHGASTAAVNEAGDTLLIAAITRGHTDVVKLLLSSGSSGQPAVDVNATDTAGDTALRVALYLDSYDMVAALLEHGAAVNVTGYSNMRQPPLLVAAATASVQCMQLLLDAGADITADSCVLHYAAGNSKHPAVLQLLLEHTRAAAMIDNLDTQCECCGPRTALMMCDQPAHLKLLLAAGADVRKTSDRGNTVLHVAAVHKYPAPVLCLLIKAGVDLHAENSDGKTAAQVAADSGNTLAAQLLTRAARDS